MGLTLSKLYDYFDAAALVEGSTKIKCRTAIRKLIAFGGNIEAAELTVQLVEAWQVWMRDHGKGRHVGMQRTAIPGYVLAVSQVCSWAVRKNLLAVNLCLEAEKMRAPEPTVEVYTADELTDLITAAGIVESKDPSARLRWTAMFLLSGCSALRPGEIWNLTWDDIDLDAEIVHVQHHPGVLGKTWEWSAKNFRPRILPLSQPALECYYRLREVATWHYPHLKEGPCRRMQALSTSLPEGTRKRPYSNFYVEFKRLRDYANGLRRLRDRDLPPIKAGRAFHQGRKTTIDAWVRNGLSVADAQAGAGHASKTTTLRFYTAIQEEAAVENIRQINRKRITA